MIESLLTVNDEEDTEQHAEFMRTLNYLIDEGLIEYEVIDGEIHLYPSS